MQSSIRVFAAYGAFWKYYADFRNRTSKEAFWKAWIVHTTIFLAAITPLYFVYVRIVDYGDLGSNALLIPLWAYSIATFIPTISIVVRRLHDIDRRGTWFWLFLVPIVGQIIFFIMLTRPSAAYDVRVGLSGKGPYVEPTMPPYSPPLYGQYSPPPYGQYSPPPYAQYNPSQYGQPAYGQYSLPPYGQYSPPAYGQYSPPPYSPYVNHPARRFKPKAGTGGAFMYIVLSIFVAVTISFCSIASSTYLNQNYSKYLNTFFGGSNTDIFNNPYDNYIDPWNDYYGYGDEWDDNYGYGDEWDYWGDDYYGDMNPDYNYGYTDEEMAAMNYVCENALPGFPEFTIEEVLLSQVDEYGLEWDCVMNYGNEKSEFYISAFGYKEDSFLTIYAEFTLRDDGVIEIYNLDDSERDEYEADAVAFYAEWYEKMLSDPSYSSS